MSILLTKGNVEDVFKVLDNHNINSSLMLDTKLKALEIIKEKDVFEPTHKYVIGYSKTYATYCKLFKVYKLVELKKLTQEEFETLKRWSDRKESE